MIGSFELHVRSQSQQSRAWHLQLNVTPGSRTLLLLSCCASGEGLGQRERHLDKGPGSSPDSARGKALAREPSFFLSHYGLRRARQDPCPLLERSCQGR